MEGYSLKRLRENTKKAMESLKWSQTMLADRAGISAVNVSRILNQGVEPTLSTVDRIAGALGLSVAALLSEKNPKPVPPPPPTFTQALAMVLETLSHLPEQIAGLEEAGWMIERLQSRIEALEHKAGIRDMNKRD